MKRRIAFFSLLILCGLVLASAYPAAAKRPNDAPVGVLPNSTNIPQIILGQTGVDFRYSSTFGITDQPYKGDTAHFNSPDGVFVDGSDNLYVVEQNGQRALGYNTTGSNIFLVGHAGLGRSQDGFLNYPRDVAKDPAGNLWVAMENAIKVFSPSGSQLSTYPPDSPWQSGSGNSHFNVPNGIAFDHNGRLFVSDMNNQRVQIYTVSGTTPTYLNTIGVSGAPGSDNIHFFIPGRIAFDGSNALYVVDSLNYRVQKCTTTDDWSSWTCSTFFGGNYGSNPSLSQMAFSSGLAIDATGNVFIADGGNNRVLKCTPAGTCVNFVGVAGSSGADNNHFGWVPALALDSSGRLYVCDQSNSRIQVFDKNGKSLKTIGVIKVPYFVDKQRYYEPWSIAVASSGGIYVGENHGDRLIKINPDGTQAWTTGHAGVVGLSTDYFGGFGASATPAENLNGIVFMPDAGNNRIQKYKASTGALIGSVGQYGQGNKQFDGPFGVAINPVNQDILVADLYNHRVQVFDHNWNYKTTIGVTKTPGGDNDHFNGPVSVAVNSTGVVFVADRNNFRVQRCTTSDGTLYTCSVFVGVSGENGDDFAHLQPSGIALDKNGRLYVADDSHNRVQVFDASGAYLTTIGGDAGPFSGELRQPEGMVVMNDGSLYITDTYNQRIQKFIPATGGWRQVNINGFGERANLGVSALAVFNSQLYASTADQTGSGARVWHTQATATDWTPASTPGFGDGSAVFEILDMAVFNGKLYAATGWNAARIYRSMDGISWENVASDGFGNAQNLAITLLTVYNGMLYAGVSNGSQGFELWRSATGNAGDWSHVVVGGFGDAHNTVVGSAAIFNGWLYISVTNAAAGDEVLKTNNGTTWQAVKTGGFGDANNNNMANLKVFNSQLYIGMRNRVTGAQIWRSSNGSAWESMITNGFNSTDNTSCAFFLFGNDLYAVAKNVITGMQVWRSTDGKSWNMVEADGMGDSNNNLWSNDATAIFNQQPFIATWNDANGAEVWQMVNRLVYLPVVGR